jgi:hypothetical protein
MVNSPDENFKELRFFRCGRKQLDNLKNYKLAQRIGGKNVDFCR